jgi:predicted SAM-dependent methyltransferase
MGIVSRLRRQFLPSPATSASPAPVAASQARPAIPEGPKLNLGCGFDIREGWINIDLHDWHKPDMVADVTNLTEIEDNYAVYALAQDVLEHIHRDRCLTALSEWNRVLLMGGLLEVRVPDVIALSRLMQAPDRQSPEQQAHLLQCMFGTQGYNGDFHYNGFTEVSLRASMSAAGFELVYVGHKDEWLWDAVARKVSHTPPDPLLRVATDEEFVGRAYEVILNREADSGGRAHFLDKLASGVPREVVLASLRAAEE